MDSEPEQREQGNAIPTAADATSALLCFNGLEFELFWREEEKAFCFVRSPGPKPANSHWNQPDCGKTPLQAPGTDRGKNTNHKRKNSWGLMLAVVG